MRTVAVRVLAWPIDSTSWLYHAVPPAAPPASGVVAQLRERASDWVHRYWASVQQAESGSKLYMKRAATALLRYVSSEEVFLRAVPADAPFAVVLHAPAESSAAVLERLRALAAERAPLHSRWYRLSCLALGITVPLMMIPIVPAIPAYYNFFRVWSNRRAWHGAEALGRLLAEAAPPLRTPLPPCTRLRDCAPGECCRVPAAWGAAVDARAAVVPCERLAPLALCVDEARAAPAAAAVEAALGVLDLTTRVAERLAAARTLREKHGQTGGTKKQVTAP